MTCSSAQLFSGEPSSYWSQCWNRSTLAGTSPQYIQGKLTISYTNRGPEYKTTIDLFLLGIHLNGGNLWSWWLQRVSQSDAGISHRDLDAMMLWDISMPDKPVPCKTNHTTDGQGTLPWHPLMCLCPSLPSSISSKCQTPLPVQASSITTTFPPGPGGGWEKYDLLEAKSETTQE